jgi:hypothetical protein
MLLSASLLIALLTRAKRLNGDRYVAHWFGLALLFVYLSIDESAAIHERLSEPLRTALNTSGSLRFAWVLVGAPLALVIALLYLRFLFHLPARTRNLFVLAGALYVAGALIVDPISANWYTPDEGITLTYWAIGTVEELMEMLGVVVLIYALLSYLGAYVQEVRIVNTGEKPPGTAPDDSHP